MIPLYALGDDARGYKMAVRHLKFQSINHPVLPNRSIIPKNDVKNTKLGNFHQSHGRKIWIFKKTSKSVENPKNKAALQIQSKKIQWEHNCLSVDNFGYILTFITFISYIFFVS